MPIILIACPAADDIYEVKKSRITDMMYKQFKVPVPFARGRGRSPVPRRVQLTHHVAEPIVPPTHDPANEEEQIEALYRLATASMVDLLSR